MLQSNIDRRSSIIQDDDNTSGVLCFVSGCIRAGKFRECDSERPRARQRLEDGFRLGEKTS
jgi:hypothetical protein